MYTFRRKGFLVYLVLILLVCSLVLAGCRSSSPPQDHGNGGGGGNGGGDGEVDISWFQGTWRSNDPVDPEVEFTVGELIERSVHQGTGIITYHFKGEINCSVLPGGKQTIIEKQKTDVYPAIIDTIHLVDYTNGTVELYVVGGHNLEDSGIVDLRAIKGTGNNLMAYVEIIERNYGEEERIYESDLLYNDKFTRVSSPGGGGDGGNGGDGDGDLDIDVSWYLGTWTWESRPADKPGVEFTIGEFIEKDVDPEDEERFNYYFTGTVKCQVLSGGEKEITKKPGSGEEDCIYCQKLPLVAPDAIGIRIMAGYDDEEGGTVKIDLMKGDDDKLHAGIEITDGGDVIYKTESFTNLDTFTRSDN